MDARPAIGQDSLDRLQQGIIQQMEQRHSSLMLELKNLKEDLKSIKPSARLAFEMPPLPEATEKAPEPVEDPAASQPDQPLKEEPLAVGEGLVVTEDGKVVDDEAPPHAFAGRPNLYAFMQAKNWDSTHIMDIQEKEYLKRLSSRVEQPSPFQRLQQIVNSHRFDMAVGLIIVANSIVMAVNLEYEGEITREQLGEDHNMPFWKYAKEVFAKCDLVFSIIFLVELLLRLICIGPSYFKSIMNWLDFLIVAFAVVEWIASSQVGNLSFMRLLRIAKLSRVLRIVRVLQVFENLRILMNAVKSSIPALGWSLILLAILQCIAAIFMTQSLLTFMRDENQTVADRKEVYLYFGTFARSFMTMFEITLAVGTWGRGGRIIIHKVGSYYIFFYLAYLCLVSFALIRVIAAIFLKETLAAAAKDNDMLMAEMNQNPLYLNSMWQMFSNLDRNGNGHLDLHEMHNMLHDDNVTYYLSLLGLKKHEVKGLFVLMDDGDGSFTFPEFVAGLMRLKASSKGVDLATLLYENKKLLKRVLAVRDELHTMHGEMANDFASMHSEMHEDVKSVKEELTVLRQALRA